MAMELEASLLVAQLHGRLRRRASEACGVHFVGLHQVSRQLLRSGGGCSTQVAKRLRHLEVAHAALRHSTARSCAKLAEDLEWVLSQAGPQLPYDA